MSDEIWEKSINEIKSINYAGEIHPYFRGEPMADTTIRVKISRLRKEFPNNRIRFNTNGDYFKYHEDVQQMFNAGISAIHISHYEEKELGKVSDGDFGSKVTHFGMKSLLPSFYNRGGLVDVPHDNGRHKFCTYPILKLFILYNGNIVLCCSDFNEEVIYGNIMRESLIDIWNKPEYEKYREYHLMGRGKELKLCDRCNLIQ
jgi:radical SAM protein with 4Fe4S-binding SPASM domain